MAHNSITTNPITVSEAIRNLPPLGIKDGAEEVVLQNYQADSEYEKWLVGKISVDELLKHIKSRGKSNVTKTRKALKPPAVDLLSHLEATA